MIKMNNLVGLLLFALVSCEDNNTILPGGDSNGDNGRQDKESKTEWLIPEDEVFDGGPGKDGIPALSNPEFIAADQAGYLQAGDLVLGMKVDNVIKAYPHDILDWHEIINDDVGRKKVAVTYCPLTGTGIGWNRFIDGSETTFGVSGLLYNTNLIPYDRKTDSYWSQIRMESVHGELIGKDAVTYQLVETTWETWKGLYPKTEVVSTNTGFNRNYGVYPYGNYKSSNTLIFPVSPSDDRLHPKERVHGIILDDNAYVFRFESFKGNKTAIIHDILKETPVVVIGNEQKNFIVSFINEDGKSFSGVENGEDGTVFKDNQNNYYDMFGYVVQGPATGERLQPTVSFIGFWFSFGAFYPNPKIYGP